MLPFPSHYSHLKNSTQRIAVLCHIVPPLCAPSSCKFTYCLSVSEQRERVKPRNYVRVHCSWQQCDQSALLRGAGMMECSALPTEIDGDGVGTDRRRQ